MLKKVFYFLGAMGFIIIFIMSFIIPKNPFEVFQATIYSLPLFVDIIILGSLMYWLFLYAIYSLINKIYIKYLNKNNNARVK